MRALLIDICCQYHYVNLLIIVYPSNYCLKNRLKVNSEGMGNKPLKENRAYSMNRTHPQRSLNTLVAA
jgi:hypothetical protein